MIYYVYQISRYEFDNLVFISVDSEDTNGNKVLKDSKAKTKAKIRKTKTQTMSSESCNESGNEDSDYEPNSGTSYSDTNRKLIYLDQFSKTVF